VRPIALSLAVCLSLFAAATRLVPEEYRLLNFAAAGAVCLFAAARLGLVTAVLVAAGGMVVSDLLLWAKYGFNPEYLPMPSVYLALGGYLAAGRLLRRTRNPLPIAAGTLLASGFFFLWTNFFSWLHQAQPYGYSLAGLADCYRAGVPFYRGTLYGDVGFTAFLFAAHELVARAVRPAELVSVAEEVRA
jgi:hypothetical protein